MSEDLSLKELYKAFYETGGGNQVSEAFKQLLTDIVGAPTMMEFSRSHPNDNLDMYNDFKWKIRHIKFETTQLITMKIPNSLLETFEEIRDEKINEAIEDSTFSSKVKFIGDKMQMSADLIKRLFKRQSAEIIAHVKDLLQIPVIKGTKNIVMIDRFSEIPILQDKIAEAFPEMRVIIQPNGAENVSVKGAVLYGHEYKDKPKYLTCRVAKFIDFFRKGSADWDLKNQ